MKFIFTIGVEGSGHHMIDAILDDFIASRAFVAEGAWHGMMTDLWNPDNTTSNKNRPDVQRMFEKILAHYSAAGITHLYETASFPFNHPRNTLRRPDLLDFVEMADGHIDLRMLVLVRDPVSAAFSALRRKFTDNVYLEAKIIEDNFIYICSQLNQCDRSLYKVLHFEDFLAAPPAYVKGLSEWFSVDEGLLTRGLNNLVSPTGKDTIPGESRAILEAFFTEKKRKQWAMLSDHDIQIERR